MIALILCVTTSRCDGKNTDAADIVVYGDIYTSNADCRKVEAFAVKDGKYIAVGTKEEVDKYKDTSTKIINAEFAMSGGIESHGHYLLDQAFKLGLHIHPYKDADR